MHVGHKMVVLEVSLPKYVNILYQISWSRKCHYRFIFDYVVCVYSKPCHQKFSIYIYQFKSLLFSSQTGAKCKPFKLKVLNGYLLVNSCCWKVIYEPTIVLYYAQGSRKRDTVLCSIFEGTLLCKVGVVVFMAVLPFNNRHSSCHVLFLTVFEEEHRTKFHFISIVWKWFLFCNVTYT